MSRYPPSFLARITFTPSTRLLHPAWVVGFPVSPDDTHTSANRLPQGLDFSLRVCVHGQSDMNNKLLNAHKKFQLYFTSLWIFLTRVEGQEEKGNKEAGKLPHSQIQFHITPNWKLQSIVVLGHKIIEICSRQATPTVPHYLLSTHTQENGCIVQRYFPGILLVASQQLLIYVAKH